MVAVVVPARAALAGNPSDGYGGSVVAIPIRSLHARVEAGDEPASGPGPDDPGLRSLVEAAARVYTEHVGGADAEMVARLQVTTTIPRSVGLAGSSAVVIGVLRLLAGQAGAPLSPPVLAALAQRAEVDELGIPAGLQDRVVQAYDHAVLMQFQPDVMARVEGLPSGRYRSLSVPEPIPAFVAWRSAAAESSAIVHADLVRRHRGSDPDLGRLVPELARRAEWAAVAVEQARWDDLGDAMDQTLDLRAELVTLRPEHAELVDVARRVGAPVNYAGSGGSIVGLHHRCGLDSVTTSLRAVGATVIPVRFQQ